MTRWRLGVAGVLAGIVLVVVLALADGDSGVGGTEIADASAATQRAGGSRFWLRGTLPVDESGKIARFTGEGVSNGDGSQAKGTVDLTGMARALEVPESELDAGDWQMKMVFDYPIVWFHYPLYREMGLKRPWAEVDYAATAERQGIDASIVESSMNPRKTLDLLRTAKGSEVVGGEHVRGVPTTHLRAELELEDYPKIVPEEKRAEAERSIDALLKGRDFAFETDVWIDRGGLIRRLRMRYPEPVPGTRRTVESDMVMEFFDFGIDVKVDRPAKSRTERVPPDWLTSP